MHVQQYLAFIAVFTLQSCHLKSGNCQPVPKTDTIGASSECVDTTQDFKLNNWISNPPYNYAPNPDNLPSKFREKIGTSSTGVFYFEYETSEKSSFDFFENQNQSIISKQREFVKDIRPTYLYMKYCGYWANTDNGNGAGAGVVSASGEQVVYVTPVKANSNGIELNQANLTLDSDLVWREGLFEIDMDQFFEGIEIDISSYNFLSGDFLFIDKLIFVQGIKLSTIDQIKAFCPLTSNSTSSTTVITNTNDISNPHSYASTEASIPTATDDETDANQVSTAFPNELESASVQPNEKTTVTTTTIRSSVIMTTIASTTGSHKTSTGKSTTTEATTSPSGIQSQNSTARISTSQPGTTSASTSTQSTIIIRTNSTTTTTTTEAPSTSPKTTSTVKTTTTTSTSDSIDDLTTESDPEMSTLYEKIDVDDETDDLFNFSSTYDPESDNATTTVSPSLLMQNWLETHRFTFYTVAPTLLVLLIFGSCFIAFRERRKGFYALNRRKPNFDMPNTPQFHC